MRRRRPAAATAAASPSATRQTHAAEGSIEEGTPKTAAPLRFWVGIADDESSQQPSAAVVGGGVGERRGRADNGGGSGDVGRPIAIVAAVAVDAVETKVGIGRIAVGAPI